MKVAAGSPGIESGGMLLGLCFASTIGLAHAHAAPPKHADAKPDPKQQKKGAHPPRKSAQSRSKVTPSRQPPHRERYPAVALFAAHVNETLAYRPHDEKGRARRDAPRELQRLLRCRQTGQQHKVAPQLAEALYEIGRHYPGHRLEIYSGYRPRAYCTRTHSRHMTGSAVDFHVEGVRNEELIAYLRKTFHPSGVGYYPNGVHVHLDLDRTADTYWVDDGRPRQLPGDTPSFDHEALSALPPVDQADSDGDGDGDGESEHIGSRSSAAFDDLAVGLDGDEAAQPSDTPSAESRDVQEDVTHATGAGAGPQPLPPPPPPPTE